MNFKERFLKNKWEILLVLLLLLISGISHGYNMFHFPYYENDEGAYISQAWSFLTQGKLAPYTYWYDHAPAGWVLIALWAKLTGGFFTFETSIHSGRVLILVLHLASTLLLYYIAKRLSDSKLAGVVAVLIFSLSPLGIYFQRRVLLDNIMIFWVLLSLAILLKIRLKLTHVIFSAVAFGIGILTKENAIFFAPAFIYAVYQRSHDAHKSFAMVKWFAISGLVVSLYFVYALMKGEFFPVGFMGNTEPHVSLITTFQEQLARGNDLPFWDKNSDFYITLVTWLNRDAFTIIAGAIATIFSILLSIREKATRISAFLSVLFWLFLLRGGLVIDFYVTPLIPLLALNMGMFVALIAKKLSGYRITYGIFSAATSTVIIVILFGNPIGQYTRDETTSQIEAINWVKKNVPQNASIAIDNYAFVDLHESRFQSDRIFYNADWFWKIQKDSEIRNDKYGNDWRNIEYIMLSHEMLKQIKENEMPLLKQALDNSSLQQEWTKDSISYRDLGNYISTNGDWMSIYKVNDKRLIQLSESWNYYKSNFIQSYGQVVDRSNGDTTTSEGQSYAMLRAVLLNDKSTFDGIWQWTQDHFQFRTQDKLFSWLWIKEGDVYKLGDSANAADADEDIALALLFAYKQWGNDTYLVEAQEVINDIWKHEVVQVNGHYYLLANANAKRDEGYLVNPSYLSPATYRIFAEVDTEHPWSLLANDSYVLLNAIGIQNGNTTYLPSNWVIIDLESGEIKSAEKYIDENADMYGFDAFRVMWRVALDAVWFNEPEAVAYLQKVQPFFTEQWKVNGEYAAVYDLNGKPVEQFASISNSIGALSAFVVTDMNLANEVYEKILQNKFNSENGYWGDKNNYYDQNWAWFGTALNQKLMPNLWAENR